MSAKKFFRKVWLKPNLLTKDVADDFPAEVSTAGKTLRNEDIARDFQEEGTELQLETLLDILNRADRLRVKRVVQGGAVKFKFVYRRYTALYTGCIQIFKWIK